MNKRSWRFARRMVAIGIVAIIAMGLVVSTAYGLNALFEVRQIQVVGTGIDVQIDISRLPRNLLMFPSETIADQLKKEYPFIKDVQVNKRFFHTVEIVIIPRPAKAILVTNHQTLEITDNGIVVGNIRYPNSLPTIRIDIGTLGLGQGVFDPRVLASLTFINEAGNLLDSAQITQLDNASLRAHLENIDIYFPQKGDLGGKAATLQKLLAGFRIKGTLPRVIDFRFEKPVVQL